LFVFLIKFVFQQIPLNEDDDTEEGEEKPRAINGHEHSSTIISPTTTLVGAKRRKCKISHKINLEDKVNRTIFFVKKQKVGFDYSLHCSTIRDVQVMMNILLYDFYHICF
jgi:hypothetical protein